MRSKTVEARKSLVTLMGNIIYKMNTMLYSVSLGTND